MRGRVFLRSLAIFAGAFALAHGFRVLPSSATSGAGLILSGAVGFLAGLLHTSAEENMLGQVFAAYLSAILLAAALLLFFPVS